MLDEGAFAAFTLVVLIAPLLHGAMDGLPSLVLRVGVVAVWMLSAISSSLRGSLPNIDPYASTALAAVVGLSLVGILRSPYVYGSVQATLDTVVIALGFVLGASLASSERRRAILIAAFVTGAAAMAVGGILQATGSDLLAPAPENRVASLYRNPNHFAGLLDLAGPLALGIALFARPLWARASSLALAALFYVNIGLTFSYGGWLASGTATIVLLIAWIVHGIRRRRFLRRVAGALLLASIALGAAFLFVDNSPRLRGGTLDRIRTVTTLDVGSLRSRVVIQEAALQMTLDHPLWGVGPGRFQTQIAGYRPPRIETQADRFLHRKVLHAMSDYLNVSTTLGLTGLVAFLAFWVAVLGRTPRQGDATRFGILAALVAILVHGFVDGNLTYVTGNAFLAFAMAGILHARVDDDADTR